MGRENDDVDKQERRGEVGTKILAALMLDPSQVKSVSTQLLPPDFNDGHEWIFKAMCEIDAAGKEVNLGILKDHLEQDGSLRILGGADVLMRIGETEVDLKEAHTYVEELRRL